MRSPVLAVQTQYCPGPWPELLLCPGPRPTALPGPPWPCSPCCSHPAVLPVRLRFDCQGQPRPIHSLLPRLYCPAEGTWDSAVGRTDEQSSEPTAHKQVTAGPLTVRTRGELGYKGGRVFRQVPRASTGGARGLSPGLRRATGASPGQPGSPPPQGCQIPSATDSLMGAGGAASRTRVDRTAFSLQVKGNTSRTQGKAEWDSPERQGMDRRASS